MNISQSDQQGVTVFSINGRIDTEGALNLEQTLHEALAKGQHRMILDVTNVRFLNSSALRTFAEVLTENRNHGGDLYFVGMVPRIKRVFEIIGFDKFFSFYDNLDTAIADF